MNTEIKQLILEVLENGYLMSLATQGAGGIWVADVIFIYDNDLNLYWMSNQNVRHSQAVEINPRVAGTITVSNPGEDNLGIQFEGMAEKIDGQRFDLATKHLLKRKKPAPKESDDVLGGYSWYVLRPKRIELICERLFAFEKKKIEL